eukprot:632900-Amphidinium_carterae.1
MTTDGRRNGSQGETLYRRNKDTMFQINGDRIPIGDYMEIKTTFKSHQVYTTTDYHRQYDLQDEALPRHQHHHYRRALGP